MNDIFFIPTDAHEGCVWVAAQRRLYFSTTRKESPPCVALHYLDFSDIDLTATDEPGTRAAINQLTARVWMEDANMANSLCLGRDGKTLLIAEQGDHDAPSRLVRTSLEDQTSRVVFEDYRGTPLNSLNKVIESRQGHVIVSDPDYGFRQGFRPPPELKPSLYVISPSGAPVAFDCCLEMPHGLALSADEQYLYVTDTSNDGAHSEGVELGRRCAVYRFEFDAESGRISGTGELMFAVDEGVPDGSIVTEEALLVGGGDGVYVANNTGQLRGKIPLDRTAVNLAAVEGHLFVTADAGVYLIPNWWERIS